MAITADALTVRTVTAGDADATSLDGLYGRREFIADPTSGGFVTVGPIADYSSRVEPNAAAGGSEQSITVDRVDP